MPSRVPVPAARVTIATVPLPQMDFDLSTFDCGCKIEVSILPRTGSGEYKFKVLSLMTAAREGSLRYGHQAGFNNRPMEARFE